MQLRTSSRSNKGQNKRLEALLKEEQEEVLASVSKRKTGPKKGQKRKKKVESKKKKNSEVSGERDDLETSTSGEHVRCPVCGVTDENYDAENDPHGDMILCDKCLSWQHISCMIQGQDLDKFLSSDGQYYCEVCNPSNFTHLPFVKEQQEEKAKSAEPLPQEVPDKSDGPQPKPEVEAATEEEREENSDNIDDQQAEMEGQTIVTHMDEGDNKKDTNESQKDAEVGAASDNDSDVGIEIIEVGVHDDEFIDDKQVHDDDDDLNLDGDGKGNKGKGKKRALTTKAATNTGPKRKRKKSEGKAGAKNAKAKILPPAPVVKPLTREEKLRKNALKMFVDLFSKYIIPETIGLENKTLEVDKEPASTTPTPKLESTQQNTLEADTQNASENTDKTLQSKAEELGKALEEALFNECYIKEQKQLSKAFPEKVRSLFSNLKDKKNLILKQHVMNKTIPFEKLVKMDVNELANPDLQQYKEKLNEKQLSKLVFERPDHPGYGESRGDEASGEYQDAIYSKNMISNRKLLADNEAQGQESEIPRREETENKYGMDEDTRSEADDDSVAKDVVDSLTQAEPVKTDEHTVTEGDSIPLKNVNISYPEVDWNLSGDLKFIGSTLDMEPSIYRTAFADGRLSVEGRLFTGKASQYLKEVKSTRDIALYQLINASDEQSRLQITSMIDSLLMSNKVLGVKPKRNYEKNIYIVGSDSPTLPDFLEEILADKATIVSSRLEPCDKTLYIVLVIKPEVAS